eukprot:CAMPEP_0185020030 /NCGR_PEP_ID=MMETSP1103-20130426/2616_1 /TAXON_ID=36769 /ORGANISM="Paraphysomonas bandaiensis, Strain Caron Lab Isolate" /LENGTH=862 /DNA_ID=CAMNT_0027550669 /DNA_START=103 /DNA_END=2691 /DNA_ORIENTATION=-
MDYFTKVKSASLKAAQQGLHIISTVTTAAHDMGISPAFSAKRPVDDFMLRFQTVCEMLDDFAKVEHPNAVDAEKILNDSKIRDHVKEILRYLQEEDARWVSSHVEAVEDEIHDHPCLEVFLQNHVMEKLCQRAKRDKPRGSLPLVLAIATSVLRVVRYPLLPHQTVHKPLCQLIGNASSLSSKYSSVLKMKSQNKVEMTAYVRKIDMHLVALISALWKRITENPELLTFFRFVDTRDGAKVRQHLDAIMCLIPLMGKPKVGLAAKEALLTAVSMHDPRVDMFILTETNLPKNVVNELCKKFASCVSASSMVVPFAPAASGTHRNVVPLEADALTRDVSGKSSQFMKPAPTESFAKVLRFCAAFVSSASNGTSYVSKDNQSLRSILCDMYLRFFLKECVRPHLLESGEQQVLATHSLLRYMLYEMSPGMQVPNTARTSGALKYKGLFGVLCPLTSGFLCNDAELLQTILPRAGSVSRAVSVSTIQLLSSLLSVSSLDDAKKLVIFPLDTGAISDCHPGEDEPTVRIPTEFQLASALESLARSTVRMASDTYWIGTPAGCIEDIYLEAALERVLSRLGGSSLTPTGHFCNSKRNIYEFQLGGPLLELTQRKLHVFLTLKYDEQVAVTGLVEKCVSLLCALLVVSLPDDMGYCIFKMLSSLINTICGMVNDLTNHLGKVQDSSSKIGVVREVLKDPIACDPRARKYVEKESQQILRMLETAVIVQEMYREVEGCLYAIEKLRAVVFSGSLTSSFPRRGATTLTPTEIRVADAEDIHTIEDDCFEISHNTSVAYACDDDCQSDYSYASSEDGSTVDDLQCLNEESFLSECADLEMSLNRILHCDSGNSIEVMMHKESGEQDRVVPY